VRWIVTGQQTRFSTPNPAERRVHDFACRGEPGRSGAGARLAFLHPRQRQAQQEAREDPDELRWLACDAMTSGGLLVAVALERTSEVPGAMIGRLVEGVPGAIRMM
jgi:hypothetical protein